MDAWDFLRISAISPPTAVADPAANANSIVAFAQRCEGSDVLVFPELCLTGYTCGDLFAQEHLLESSLEQLGWLCTANEAANQLWVVGLPLRVDGQLFNCAAAIGQGKLLAVIPKTYLPTYQEFYESRWFTPSTQLRRKTYQYDGAEVPLGTDVLVRIGPAIVGIEICEDLWMPIPPSSVHALAGANVLLNLSASNETIGKAAWRTQLVTSQSGRCLAAYAYSSSGPTESTTDVVFGGHCMIAELGSMLAESPRVGTDWTAALAGSIVTADVDLHRVAHDRQVMQTMLQGTHVHLEQRYREVDCGFSLRPRLLRRTYSGQPFVPAATAALDERCEEIFQIQRAALAKRIGQLRDTTSLAIGVSGGLDSTLALLVAARTCDDCGYDRKRILGLTMPGFGTSDQTRGNALALMDSLGITQDAVDIRATCLEIYRGMKHHPFGIDVSSMGIEEFQEALQNLPERHHQDLVFENVQARTRTLLLMSRGFVLGTGDMSEGALGWSTYNGDHMSMYNVNCSVPKTLVKFLVQYIAEHGSEPELRKTLLDIVGTPISPELLPLGKGGKIAQSTEATLGPYELHDFFLYHFIRTGASPQRLRFLAANAAFTKDYSAEQVNEALETFLRRFFANQFKRSCVPDGPKIGSVSLSPRGDWRMPSDASSDDFLK